jgi:hypothetical protein
MGLFQLETGASLSYEYIHHILFFLYYRYMLQLKDEKVEEYFKKVTGLGQTAGCQVYII